MKKLLCSIIAIMLCLTVACVTGCGGDKTQKQLEEVQSQLQQITEKLNDLQEENKGTNDKLNALQEENKTINDRLSDLDIENTKGKFMTVTEAYECGFLTIDDVKSIAYYHNSRYGHGGRLDNEEVLPEDYEPLPITPEALSESVQKKIKNTHLERYYAEVTYATLDGVSIEKYYGTFNGCVAVVMDDDYSGGPGISWKEIIEGITISQSATTEAEIWVEVQ